MSNNRPNSNSTQDAPVARPETQGPTLPAGEFEILQKSLAEFMTAAMKPRRNKTIDLRRKAKQR
jgi:hypothetical protein